MIYADTLIFDLDGTLLDTLCDLCNSTNYALKECNFPERNINEIKSFIGNGVEILIRKAVPKDTSEDKIQECLSLFKIHYLHNSKNFTKPFDGIVKMLENLRKKGFKIAVISNKFDNAVKKLCNEYFYGLVDIAVGESIETPKKPSPEGIFKILKILNADKNKSIMIGDSEVDIQTAKNAGIYSIGVLWGYRNEETLTSAGADELIDSPERLEFIL